MASLSRDKSGNTRVLFVTPNGKRSAVYLGKVPRKQAEAVKLKVEHLVAAAAAKLPLDNDTATWVNGIGDELARKLAAIGLIP